MIQRIGRGLFILLIVLLGFMQPGISFKGMQVIAADLIFPLVLIFALPGLFKHWTNVPPKTFTILLLLYVGVMAASATLSVDPVISAVKMTGIVYLVGLAFVAAVIALDRKMLKTSVLVWVATSTFVSVLACFAVVVFYVSGAEWAQPLLHHYGSLIPGNYPRVQSTFIYPAMLCNYLTVGILLTLGAHRSGWISSRVKYFSIVVHAVAAIFTLTPGLGGFVAALFLWVAYWQHRNRKVLQARILVATGICISIAAVLISAFSVMPIETSPYTFSLVGFRIDPTQRLLAWQDGIATFSQFPFFGNGVGMPVASVLFKSPSGMQMLTDAHQTAISVLANGGIFTFTVFAGLVIYVLRSVRRVSISTNEIGAIRVALWLALFSGLFIQGFVGSFEDARHLWVLMGLIIAAERVDSVQVKIPTQLEEEPHASHLPIASEVRPV